MHVKYRIDGVLQAAMRPIDKRFHSTIISRVKVMAELDIAEKRVPQDGRFKVRMGGKSIDFRVSIMPSVHGEDAVIRILDKESISEQFHELRLDILGFPEDELRRFRKYIAEPYGMVLVTGPTGSGKTTTLYAALSEIKSIEDKIITIEDPVEYQLRGITQIPINEKKGLTFARGLRSILRHDPDKIMVGEIRDAETAQIAINSALTGHLVFTTVHANNVLDVLGRFLNMGVEAYQFVSALNCVLAQRLVRNICVHCKRPAVVTRAQLEESALDPGARVQRPVLRRRRLHRVRRHRLQGADGDLRAARPQRQHPGADSGQAADLRDQEGGARRRDAVPARERGRAGAARQDHAARNQQGHVRRMSQRTSSAASWLASPPPSVAVEITATRVVAVALDDQGGSHSHRRPRRWSRSRPGVATPALNAANVHDEAALDRGGRAACSAASAARTRRVALVLPDSAAKVSLRALREGAGEAAGSRAADSLAGAQGRAVPHRGRAGRRGRRRSALPGGGREYLVTVARRDVVAELRAGVRRARACTPASSTSPASTRSTPCSPAAWSRGDWLLVNVAAGLRHARRRPRRPRRSSSATAAPAASAICRTWCIRPRCITRTGWAAAASRGSCSPARRCWAPRKPSGSAGCSRSASAWRVEPIDFRPAVELRDRIAPSPELLDMLAPAVGVLLRDRVARRTPPASPSTERVA